ncbi:hypothetical protein [Bifidobacterium vespertilionis]|uniref:DUF5648 domain-containing protein n=1 Tax=Bifidobacterium vespertilionis TaxID=2562524 RepID=A0A5J5DWW9_9BIFI|nr:hypothetical protein [Bifidobacterium vespertilionis]KAA8821016.1 hypothetical protein EM848_11665 [Bifidobacterium vespertilionis]KAA8821180.1 hypothetical protein EMO90_05200 [Bifidobacterium vespertilionis]
MTTRTNRLFTTDGAERNKAVNDGRIGGIQFQTAASLADGAKPVRRLYNLWNGGHLFTTDRQEADRLAGLSRNVEESGFNGYANRQ